MVRESPDSVPAIPDLDRYETLHFTDSTSSIYRGPPSTAGDAAWDRFIKGKMQQLKILVCTTKNKCGH